MDRGMIASLISGALYEYPTLEQNKLCDYIAGLIENAERDRLSERGAVPESDEVHIRTDRGLWRPKAEGYTSDLARAGRWPRGEAERITAHLGPEKCLRLIPAAPVSPAQQADARVRRMAEHCCVPEIDEPFFVLLGRDPQAPWLVEKWAQDRALVEPGDKATSAFATAKFMRMWKDAHPERGLSMKAFAEIVNAKAAPQADGVRERISRVLDNLNSYGLHSEKIDVILAALSSVEAGAGENRTVEFIKRRLDEMERIGVLVPDLAEALRSELVPGVAALSQSPTAPGLVQSDASPGAQDVLDSETIQTLLDLLNPLHGALDEQTYDEKMRGNFDVPDSAEYTVNITSRMECDLTQAVLILEDRKRAAITQSDEQLSSLDAAPGVVAAAEWHDKAIIALEAIAKLQGAAIDMGPAIASGFFEARARSLASDRREEG